MFLSDKNPESDYSHGLCVRRTLWEESVRQCHGRDQCYDSENIFAEKNVAKNWRFS
jgi:hypothetical protein